MANTITLDAAILTLLKTGHHAHLRGSCDIAILPADVDLMADYDNPKSHRALIYTRGYPGPNYRFARVWIDHEETGTRTTGTGDTTCCRKNPNRA